MEGLSQAHCNLFIPSTLHGPSYRPNGLDKEILDKNLLAATDVYIYRVNGAMCFGSPIHLLKGGPGDLNN